MSVFFWSIIAYLTNRPKNHPIFGLFGRKRAINQNSLVNFGQLRALPFTTSDGTGDIEISPIFPVRHSAQKSLACAIHSLQARLCPLKRGNDTCPYIPTWLISQQLSMLLWDLPPADSTSPCAAAWGCPGRTARSALGAPSNSAGSRSDSR